MIHRGCMIWCGELFMHSQEDFFGVYFPSCFATRQINSKITIKWAHKQFVTTVHSLFYSCMTWWKNKLWSKRQFSHIYFKWCHLCLAKKNIWSECVLVMMSQLIVQHWWWCHNWLGSCDTLIWKLIYNLNIWYKMLNTLLGFAPVLAFRNSKTWILPHNCQDVGN